MKKKIIKKLQMIKISKISITKTFEIPIITKLPYYSISSSSNRIYIFKSSLNKLNYNIIFQYFIFIGLPLSSLIIHYPKLSNLHNISFIFLSSSSLNNFDQSWKFRDREN